MADAETDGKWFDTQASKVVDSPPKEGVQLRAPGVEETPEIRDAVKAAELAAKYETATDPAPVEVKADTGGDPAKTVTTASTRSGKG